MMHHRTASSYEPMHVPATHIRRPSEPMPSWLSRTPTLKPAKAPSLGLGATIVRTPDEALRDTGVRITYKAKVRPTPKRAPPPSPTSPPLPPLPLPEEDEQRVLQGESAIRPSRPVFPADLQRTPSRSSLKIPKAISTAHSSSSSDEPPSVPPLPSHIAASTQPPPFLPILVAFGSAPVNPDKVVVTLETCTQTYRTTLSTLTSRQSHLAKYLSALCPPPGPIPIAPSPSTSSSVYSTQTDDPRAPYNVPITSTVHIFLDRPSAPYAHILAYLRQPLADDSLPYALQLHNYVSSTIQASSPSILQSKLDTLIEVRDEAAYLNLEGLQRLCVDEIRNRYNSKQQLMIQMHGSGQGQHMRGLSSSSMQSLHSLHASIYNLHPLQEKAEAEVEAIVLNSTSTSSIGHPAPSPLPSSLGFNNASSGAPGLSAAAISIRRGSKQALAPSLENIAPTPRTPPTPQSFEGRGAPDQTQNPSQSQANRSRSSSRSRPTAPAGWI